MMLEVKYKSQDAITYEKENPKAMTFYPGEIVALLGKNGAGNTTFINGVTGIKIQKNMNISIDGERINRWNRSQIAIGSCEHTFLKELTPLEQMEYNEANFPAFDMKRFYMLIEYFKIPLNRQMKTFSIGEKNQIETVLALSQGAKYIFLDEPLAIMMCFIVTTFINYY